jgi:hypothetical protein
MAARESGLGSAIVAPIRVREAIRGFMIFRVNLRMYRRSLLRTGMCRPV